MKPKSQMGNYDGGCISRGCKARRAASDESKEGRLGNYLSLYFSNWLLSGRTLFSSKVQKQKFECNP